MINVLRPTPAELLQKYMKNFYIRPVDRVDDGPPVFQIEGGREAIAIAFGTSGTVVAATLSSHQDALPNREHSHQLEEKIDALHDELITMQTDIGEELQQHRSEIQNITTIVRQILEYVGPKVVSITFFNQ